MPSRMTLSNINQLPSIHRPLRCRIPRPSTKSSIIVHQHSIPWPDMHQSRCLNGLPTQWLQAAMVQLWSDILLFHTLCNNDPRKECTNFSTKHCFRLTRAIMTGHSNTSRLSNKHNFSSSIGSNTLSVLSHLAIPGLMASLTFRLKMFGWNVYKMYMTETWKIRDRALEKFLHQSIVTLLRLSWICIKIHHMFSSDWKISTTNILPDWFDRLIYWWCQTILEFFLSIQCFVFNWVIVNTFNDLAILCSAIRTSTTASSKCSLCPNEPSTAAATVATTSTAATWAATHSTHVHG